MYDLGDKLKHEEITGWEEWGVGNEQWTEQVSGIQISNTETAVLWRKTDTTLQRWWMLSLGTRDVGMGLGGWSGLGQRGQCHGQSLSKIQKVHHSTPACQRASPQWLLIHLYVFSRDNLRSWGKLETVKLARDKAKTWAQICIWLCSPRSQLPPPMLPHLEHSEFTGSGGAHGMLWKNSPKDSNMPSVEFI